MEETIIEFKTAELFKEIGFDIPLYTSYINGVFHKNEAEPNGYDGWDVPDKENWNKKDWVFTKEGNSCFGCKLDNIKYFEACSAPTQSLAQKYLREKHNIHIVINGTLTDYHPPKKHKSKYEYYYEIFVNFMEDHCKKVSSISNRVLTYEQALEAGLYEAALIVKNKK